MRKGPTCCRMLAITISLLLVVVIGNVHGEIVCTAGKADVLFLLDSSGSVGRDDFNTELAFVSNFVNGFTIGPTGVQFSVAVFSTDASSKMKLNQFSNLADLQMAITNCDYIGGGTNTANALAIAQESFLPSNGGRADVEKIVIVVTDGASNYPADTAREATLLHKLGIRVFAVGVGSTVNGEELHAIASHPSNVFTVMNFDSLGEVKAELQKESCPDVCGEDALALSVSVRILNGDIAGECQWPWVVAVRLGSGNVPAQMCAGVLIGRRKIITTASCVHLQNVHSVVVGEHNIMETDIFEKTVRVDRTVLHPQFKDKENDVAVIHVVENVEYNQCVLPACLPSQICQPDITKNCSFAGWGFHTDAHVSLSHELRSVSGRYMNPKTCAAIYKVGRNTTIPEKTGCIDAHINPHSPCKGDEGGMVGCPSGNKWIIESLINVPVCTESYPSLGVHIADPDILNFIKEN